jgi:hypothetical protein
MLFLKELLCLSNNPVSIFFPTTLNDICITNPKCTVKILEKCEYSTSTIAATTTEKIPTYEGLKIIQKPKQFQG